MGGWNGGFRCDTVNSEVSLMLDAVGLMVVAAVTTDHDAGYEKKKAAEGEYVFYKLRRSLS